MVVMIRGKKEYHSQPRKEDLSDFLKHTYLIDCDNPRISRKAEELTKDCKTDVEKAKALFEFVRDSASDNQCKSFKASNTMECGGTSCYKRSILLTALCRAIGLPARLHLQKVHIKKWKKPDGEIKDITFAHGITGIYLNGNWHLYESVGNKIKWLQWTQDEKRASEMPIKFYPDRDCLFKPDEKIITENLPVYFASITAEWIELVETLNDI